MIASDITAPEEAVQKLDKVPFLILLLEAAKRFEALAQASKTPLAAARVAIDVGIAPKSGIGVRDDLVEAIVFYGSSSKYKNVSWNILVLAAQLHEERAWASYEKHYAARQAA